MRPIEPRKSLRVVVVPFTVISLFSLPLSAGEDGGGMEGFADHAARTSSRDVKIPKALVEKIEKSYRGYLLKLQGLAAQETITRGLINITAELTQTRSGALHENSRVATPLGGGVVDLSELVTPVRGVFNLKLQARREKGETLTSPRVFFISHAKERLIEGESYGAGCDKYMEITTSFRKKWERRGFDLYTASQRYVSVIGGTFIFVDFAKEALYVGSVTFNDPRYANLMCD